MGGREVVQELSGGGRQDLRGGMCGSPLYRRALLRCVAKRLIVEALDGVGGHQGGGGEHHPGGADSRQDSIPISKFATKFNNKTFQKHIKL